MATLQRLELVDEVVARADVSSAILQEKVGVRCVQDDTCCEGGED